MPGAAAPDPIPVPDFQPLAHKLAYRHQRREADHWDLVQTGQLRLLEATRQRCRRGQEIREPVGFAWSVLNHAMQDYYERDPDAGLALSADLPEGALPDVLHRAYSLDAVCVRKFLDTAREKLSDRAMRILREIHDPSPDVVARAEASRGKTCRITFEHIRKALGIPTSTFYYDIKRIRTLAQEWWDLDGSPA